MKRIGILGFLVVALVATSACVPRRSKQTTNVSTVSTGSNWPISRRRWTPVRSPRKNLTRSRRKSWKTA